jgi:hypothetical protein
LASSESDSPETDLTAEDLKSLSHDEVFDLIDEELDDGG